MRESELHELIYERSRGLAQLFARTGTGAGLLIGPGDDAAALRTPAGDTLLLTTDQLVEGRHFTPDTSAELIARKAIARSVSDLAAMGGTPMLTLATGLLPHQQPHHRSPADPARSTHASANDLFNWLHHWAAHWGCPLVGGDIATHAAPPPAPPAQPAEPPAPHDPLVLTTTVVGLAGPRLLTRSGARPGDELWLTGPIGGSFHSGRHLTFEPRLAHGRAAARDHRAHAAIDLSDGLGRDAARIGRASGVRLVIHADRLPLHADVEPGPDGSPAWLRAAGDGEDHELLLCLAPRPIAEDTGPLAELTPPLLGPIGTAEAPPADTRPGAVIIDPAGREHDAAELGWDH